MFHPLHRCSPSSAHYNPYTSSSPSFLTFSPYEEQDHHLDLYQQLALARQQQARREAEEAALLRRQQQLALQREVERRRIEAYQAALEQQAYEEEEMEQERRYRARQLQAMRERQQRQRVEEEYRRKLVAALEQREQQQHQRQQQKAAPQPIAEPEPQAVETEEQDNHPFHPLLQLLFGSQPSSSTTVTKKVDSTPQPQPQPQLQTTETAPAEPAPAALPSTSTPPAPIADEPAAQDSSSSTEDNTEDQLQQHYRTHLHRRQALSTLATLAKEFESQQSSFALPPSLVFQPSPPPSTIDGDTSSSSSATPKLAFQSTNAPFLAYEDFLVRHLSKIDAVSSGGDKTVKLARKQLVKRVDAELARLDAEREKAWKEEKERAGADVEMTDDAADPECPPLAESSDPTPSLSAPETATDDTPPPVANSTSPAETPAPTPDPSIPLTADSLACLLTSSRRPARDPSSSDEETESTLSVESLDATDLMNEVMRRAMKLGEEVSEKERLSAEVLEQQKPVEVTV